MICASSVNTNGVGADEIITAVALRTSAPNMKNGSSKRRNL